MKKLLTALALISMLTATAHAQQPHTDKDFDRLKGPVKSVIVKTASLKKQGKRYVEQPRTLDERVIYNTEGNRVEDESFLDGDTPVTKNVYRYVGGEKLADGQVIIPSLVIIAPVVPRQAGRDKQPAPPPVPRPDSMERVSEKYKYKYDDKGRVRELTIEQDGRVRTKVTYDHQSSRMEMRTYKDGDTLSYRRVDRFDAQDNLVESTAFNIDFGGSVDKSSYTAYEFDARGNWVKRVKAETRDGDDEERLVEYRTITYF